MIQTYEPAVSGMIICTSGGRYVKTVDHEQAMKEKDDEINNPQRTYCAYCGFVVEIDDEGATKIGEHIATCEKHPMRVLEEQIAALTPYKMFFESCSCLFAEGVEFMTKVEIYDAIKKEVKLLESTRKERMG